MSQRPQKPATVADLAPAPYNPRTITDEAARALEASMVAFGDISGIVFNFTTGNLVAGHQRRRVLQGMGAEAIEWAREEVAGVDGHERRGTIRTDRGVFGVRGVHWPLEKEMAANVAANSPTLTGAFDDAMLGEVLGQIEAADADLFGALRFEELWAVEDAPKEGRTDPDEVPEAPPEPRTKRGDLWLLGEHRLLCGDSTNADDVARLMGGRKINIAFTSPPYASQRKYDESSGFKPIPPDDYCGWFEAVQANVRAHLAQDGSWFVNIKEHAEDGQRHLYVKDLTIAHVRLWGWRFVDELCWRNLANGVPGVWPDRFKNAWEPIFHFARNAPKMRAANVLQQTSAAFVYGERGESQTGTPFMQGGVERDGLARPSNVIEARPATDGLHEAPFPVAIPSFFIKAYTDAGDVVYEPFCGSGTTLIAAQDLDRACYGMEISPIYCDVIVRRWEAFTGKTATMKQD